MADVVLTKYEGDFSQIEKAAEKVYEEFLNIEKAGNAAFDGVSNEANAAASSLNNVNNAGKKAGDGLNQAGAAAKKAKSDFNGLQNSINQISRELPAFTFSMQTGFLAISNNLPILFDELNRVKSANKALAAEGKQTQSVLSQVGAALLSWQTALSIGVTLLTTLVPKLFETKEGLKAQTLATKLAKEEQEAYNKVYEDQIRRERRANRGMDVLDFNQKLESQLKTQFLIQDVRKEGLKGLESELKVLKELPETEENAAKVFQVEQAVYDEKIRRLQLYVQESNDFNDKRLEYRVMIDDLEVEKEANRQKYLNRKQEEENDELLHSLQRRKELYEAAGRDTLDTEIAIFNRRIALETKDDIKRRDLIAQRDAFLIKTLRERSEEEQKAASDTAIALAKIESDAATKRRQQIDNDWQYELKKTEAQIAKLTDIEKANYSAELGNERTQFARRREIVDKQEGQDYITKEEAAKARMEIDKAEAEARISQIEGIGNAIQSLAQIAGEDTEAGKALAVAATTIDTYVAAQRAYTGGFTIDPTGILSTINAGVAVVSGLARVQKILSVNVPKPKSRGTGGIPTEAQTFKDGVIDLEGPGTTTSDSIPAWLSRGESVIKASSTAGYRDELRALNSSPLDYEKLLRTKYVEPALDAERKQVADMADNIARSLAIHNAFTDKNIVKELRASRESNKQEIENLTEVIARNSRATDFEKRLYKTN